jgi:hypothetical protein
MKMDRSQLRLRIKVILENYLNGENIGAFIRRQLKLIYDPLGLWGRAPNPNDNCLTNYGVINIYPHSEQYVWSIVNRFDTNQKIHDELMKLFLTHSDINSEEYFRKWIEKNRQKLFGPGEQYTRRFVDMMSKTVESGNKSESFAVDELEKRFPGVPIKRFCSGDIRDTTKGIDISVEHPEKPFNVQVKPFTKIERRKTENGTEYIVNSIFTPERYSEKDVNVFMFVKTYTKEFIIFKNEQNKIKKIDNNTTVFYNPPRYTNIVFKD